MQEEEAHNSCKTQCCEEQVAEAALLSIGGVLEWQSRKPARSWEATEFKARFDTEVDGEEGEIIYLVRTWRANSLRAHVTVSRFLSDGVWDGADAKWFDTVTEAKAACEIHVATGQFPPSVERI